MTKIYTESSLTKAINQLISKLIGDLKLDVTIDLDENDMGDNLKDSLYLITREAVTNIKLHAQAKQAEVKIDGYSNHIHLFIQDDGCGFSLESITKNKNGLARIQKHVIDLAGTYEMDTHQGSGVAHSIYIPLPIAWTNQAKLRTKICLGWEK